MLIESQTINLRNNEIEISILASIYANGAFQPTVKTIDPTKLTKVQLLIGTMMLDSSINPEYFDLTNTDRFIFKLGSAGLSTGIFVSAIYAFDSVNILGIKLLEFIINNSQG